MSTTPDHVYLDLSIMNDDVTGTGTSQNLYFTEIRNTPIIDNPTDYQLSVLRFTLETPARTLPIFIPSMDTSPSNTDPTNLKTNYYVTLTYDSTLNPNPNISPQVQLIATVPVLWLPEDLTQRYVSDNTSPYYYCWSVDWFLALVNGALNRATIALLDYFSAHAMYDQDINNPILIFDEATSTFTMLVGSTKDVVSANDFYTNYNNTTGLPPCRCSIWFNEPLMNLFSSFSSIYYGTSPYNVNPSNILKSFTPASTSINYNYPNILSTNHGVCAYQLYFPFQNFLNQVQVSGGYENPPYTYLEYQQEYPALASWSPVSSIVFTSSVLPIRMSQTSPSEIYNDNSTINRNGNNSQIIPLISDFVVPLTTGLEYKPSIEYAPAAEYRLIDLLGSSPINNVDFSVFWKDKYGNIIPFQLGSQCTSTLKLLFRKKGTSFKEHEITSITPDLAFLDLSVVNDDVIGTGSKQNLYFTESRNAPIISNPKDYYMSILRFTLDTPARSLPIFIPSMDTSLTNNDPTQLKTNYYVTIKFLSLGIVTVPVFWLPEDTKQRYVSEYPSPYYYCWSVKWFLGLVNAALNTAGILMNQLLVTIPDYAHLQLPPPFITFDQVSSTFSLLVPSPHTNNLTYNSYYTNYNNNYVSPIINYWSLYFNEPLMNLFSSFSSIYYGTSLSNVLGAIPAASPLYPNKLLTNPGICAYQLYFLEFELINEITIEGKYYLEYQQAYPAIACWNPISSIVFTSTVLPIVMNQSSAPTRYNDSNSGNNAQILPLICDFVVPLATGLEYKPSIEYAPAAEFRLLDLLGNGTINNVDFSVFWKDKYGNLIPFQLGSQCMSTLKILFRKKGLANNGYNM